ncbi:hypothetical protein [Cupriavidus basilensis]|uniref:hypothetical protein n=1 Tax=Cupriavidus basilensis TaxID=68895 RepID=UPI0023E7ABCF|nr:hypothetical protein [Cupriavidus basilensis]
MGAAKSFAAQTMPLKILKEQIRELEDQEILHVETAFRHSYGIEPFLSPDTVLRNLAANITKISGSTHDLAAFEDIKNLKAWLKTFRLAPPASVFDEMMPF